MFKLDPIDLDNSFIVVNPYTPLIDIKHSFVDYKFVVVLGETHHIIANNEWNLMPVDNDSMPVGKWLEKVKWIPSPIHTITELYALQLDWSRPILVKDHEKEDVMGILTANQWIQQLVLKNKEAWASFSTLAETINDAVTAVDQEGNVICWNTVAEGTYKIKRENILGQKIGEHFQSDSIILHRILNEGRPVRGTYHRPNNDNHVLINASPIIKDNKIIGGIATEHDITQIVRLNEELDSSSSLLIHQQKPFSSIIGVNAEIQQALKVAQKVAYADIPVLVTGESGSGKEMLAQAIHYEGSKRNGPFVSVNCSVIPPTLLEIELFGYQEGAFTADNKIKQVGKVEQACNGTLFIEEIDKMPLDIQEKFLKYLEDHSFYRVGEAELVTLPTNTRVIASTSQALETMASKGEFNENLYYHLTVITIDIPPLRKRTEDIVKLVQQFVQEFSSKYKKKNPEISSEVMNILVNYNWPGNVQELRNVVERFILLNDENIIKSNHLPNNITNHYFFSNNDIRKQNEISLQEKEELLMIKDALHETYGNKSAAANLLGISRGTLYNKIKEYGLN
ncbi:sigma-54 interaction domain-containing protein [Priestia megaterium]|uniref:sigma-54 interaction domain-containing protein n=1 Tax=Priestia megaterium TaxID=1404 RepID=UPI002452E7B5|nr:sigma 54-interacting transcriptional regulator [Priestia megaterium]MDH3139229.1 sigma 54-interacting transcriptional regulator [Priestia megaterium]MED4265297.1 sigma 54-interacting transcriptional regulator [Priestia megaterium]MED4279881.1 sigma 54-interacting transcriptional regulator [Priestia megaterium]MED4319056.1 sigma 54-interacting transcriptional regulator [Priestia megaterium]